MRKVDVMNGRSNRRRPDRNPRVIALLVGMSLLFIGGIGLGATQADERSLDSYPGFATSPDGAVRDDLIAYWEAYQRELIKQTCMQAAGFQYFLAVAFPEHATLALAEALDVDAAKSVADPVAENASYMESLGTGELNRYSEALYGETAEDIAFLNRTEEVPAGRGADFAMGGCTGEAHTAVPSIWTLRHELAPQIQAVRTAAHAEGAPAEYAACAAEAGAKVDSPMDLDTAIAAGTVSADQAEIVRKDCDHWWVDAMHDLERPGLAEVVERNRDALDAQAARYDGVPAAIGADLVFRDFLSRAAALAASAADSAE